MKHRPLLRLILLTGCYTFITASLFAQPEKKQISFSNFISQFPTVQLPDTIQYTADEFDYGYYEPEGNDDEADTSANVTNDSTSIKYRNSVLPKPDSLIISDALVQTFLLADTEHVYIYWPEYKPDTIHPVYYFSKRFITGQHFYCVVYEKQFVYSGAAFCQKYLCTLTRNGKLIDKIKVASADYSGTGFLHGDFRVPWFPDEKSIISKAFTIYNFKEGISTISHAGSGKV